jgi:hypothetical protein
MIHIPYRLRHCGTSGGCQNISEDVVLPSFDGDRTSESYNGSFGRGVVCLAEIAVHEGGLAYRFQPPKLWSKRGRISVCERSAMRL